MEKAAYPLARGDHLRTHMFDEKFATVTKIAPEKRSVYATYKPPMGYGRTAGTCQQLTLNS
jgi:hypothetical protein